MARRPAPDARPGGERHQLLVCVKADDLVPGGVSAEASPPGARVPPETLRRTDGTPIDATPPGPPRPLRSEIRAPRAPSSGPPNYHWAIGVVAPAA
ncbi:MAG: hypothetical protein IT385_06790 [Deltaproteobacteria bacterium]|nr:hypothetical protein [Deltaproteobacteria bacterium]